MICRPIVEYTQNQTNKIGIKIEKKRKLTGCPCLFIIERERRRSARFRRRSLVPSDLKDLHDGKEIYEALSQATDPDAIKVSVTLIHIGR